MEKTATLNLRINPEVKKTAEIILTRLGIPMSIAIDMFLKQVTLTGGIPFAIMLPKAPDSVNADTMDAAQIRMKLSEGVSDIEEGRVRSARVVFAEKQERHLNEAL